jgi:hypothetical protein
MPNVTPSRPSSYPAVAGAAGPFRPEALRHRQEPTSQDETLLVAPRWIDPLTAVLLLVWLVAMAASKVAPDSVPGSLLRLLLP